MKTNLTLRHVIYMAIIISSSYINVYNKQLDLPVA